MLFYSLLLSLIASCHYQWQPDFEGHLRPTISVPFVNGDEDGMFTAQIIETISASGLADVRSHGGQYLLKVSILGEEMEKIGFRVDPQKVDGKVRRNLLASEGRRAIKIEALICQGDDVVRGPYLITADADYDYVDGDSIQDLTFVNPEGATVTVLPFSLGQLEPNESAALASTRPLYRKLAQKILDAISSESGSDGIFSQYR